LVSVLLRTAAFSGLLYRDAIPETPRSSKCSINHGGLIFLLPVPHPRNLSVPHLLLQLENAKHERLACWWAARNVDIDWHNPITPTRHRVAVVIITATVRTTSHRNNPSRIRHLIIHLSESRGHLVGECTGNNHNIGLTRGGAENYTKTILIVARCREMHHFDGAACKTKCHRPKGTLTCPIRYLIKRGPSRGLVSMSMTQIVPISQAREPQHKEIDKTYNANCITPFFPS